MKKLTFCQNDSTIWGSFWKKDSLITSILLELRMSVYFGIFKPSCKFDAPPSRFTYQIECNKFKWICVDDMSIKLHLDNNLNVWVVKKITKHRSNAPLRLVTFSATQTLLIRGYLIILIYKRVFQFSIIQWLLEGVP